MPHTSRIHRHSIWLAWFIVLLWGGSTVASAVLPGYEPPVGLNEVFMIVASYLFAQNKILGDPAKPEPEAKDGAGAKDEEDK